MSNHVDYPFSRSGTVGERDVSFGATSQTTDTTRVTWTKVQFNSVVWNTGGGTFDTGNYRWTAPIDGRYQFVYGHESEAVVDIEQYVNMTLYKNGSQAGTGAIWRWYSPKENGEIRSRAVYIVDANQADYFEVYWYHSADQNSNYGDGFFGGHLL